MRLRLLFCMLILCFESYVSQAQSPLLELLQKAEKNYPALQAQKYQSQIAQEGIYQTKTTYLPSLDAAYQLNYATYNNITGMASPLAWIPISGPPSADNQFGGTFGSSLGVLANWQPITFGQQKAETQVAQKQYEVSLAQEKNAIYLHQSKVISAYLDYMLSVALTQVYAENYQKFIVQLTQAKTLTINGLRPGVDTALVKSELSKAKIDQLNALNTVKIQQIRLSELLAEQSLNISYDSTFFQKLPEIGFTGSNFENHPLLLLNMQNKFLAEVQKSRLQKSLYPKVNLWGTLYARGSGIDFSGEVNTLEGLGFSRFNYGFGLQISMPLLKFSEINSKIRQQDSRIQLANSHLSQTVLQLYKEGETAITLFENARLIAQEMPAQVADAEYAYQAMQSRYGAGLVNYTDLLQVQLNWIKAQTERKRAYYEVWKALLYYATSKGELNVFLNQY